jgi:hypothetical protein
LGHLLVAVGLGVILVLVVVWSGRVGGDVRVA